MVNRLEKIFRGMVYVLPVVLFFSYQPLMHFGASESMNFEISLPLIWLVLFDVLVVWLMGKKKMLFRRFSKKWVWLLLPIWLSLSVLWSLNSLRGLLTVGIVWLIWLAVDGLVSLRSLFKDVGIKEKFWKVFFGSSLVICAWCWIQCVLDLVGVPREYSLMCEGCTYHMFGFPHPDGFAIEPQFMGNLLLAPTLIAMWLWIKTKVTPISDTLKGARSSLRPSMGIILVFIFTATLFLTFSRGAIYAFLIAMVVMTVWQIIQTKKWKTLLVWPVVGLAFLFTLNAQGIMAAASPTNDTYQSGVAKVINHLTLGVVDLRDNGRTEVEVVENPVENFEEIETKDAIGIVDEGQMIDEKNAAFDGYVAESTDTRLRLSGAAFEVWRQDFKTAVIGVGLGGAAQALYVNNLSPAPKEIVQNQYSSILLETGVIGVILCVLTLVLVVRMIWQSPLRVVLISLLVAYGISLLFFSGLPNALQIYLLPAAIYAIGLRKKLVS